MHPTELTLDETSACICRGLAETTSTEVAREARMAVANLVDVFLFVLERAQTEEEARQHLEKFGRLLGTLIRDVGADVMWDTAPDVVRKYAEKMAETTGLSVEEVRKSRSFQEYASKMTSGGK